MKVIAGVMFASVASIGLTGVVSASSEFPDCTEAWYLSTAYQSCTSISQNNSASARVPQIEASGFRTCTVNVYCKKGDGFISGQRADFDVTQVPQLSNCNGLLKVGQC